MLFDVIYRSEELIYCMFQISQSRFEFDLWSSESDVLLDLNPESSGTIWKR